MRRKFGTLVLVKSFQHGSGGFARGCAPKIGHYPRADGTAPSCESLILQPNQFSSFVQGVSPRRRLFVLTGTPNYSTGGAQSVGKRLVDGTGHETEDGGCWVTRHSCVPAIAILGILENCAELSSQGLVEALGWLSSRPRSGHGLMPD